MQNLVIRDATPSDFEAICALNLAEIQHTSAMDVDRRRCSSCGEMTYLCGIFRDTSWSGQQLFWALGPCLPPLSL
jgi:hypothetical protein